VTEPNDYGRRFPHTWLFVVRAFAVAWRRCETQGQCDEFAGADYRRVFRRWVEAGMPEPICHFIRRRANLPP
jgi:hypothetical protein